MRQVVAEVLDGFEDSLPEVYLGFPTEGRLESLVVADEVAHVDRLTVFGKGNLFVIRSLDQARTSTEPYLQAI